MGQNGKSKLILPALILYIFFSSHNTYRVNMENGQPKFECARSVCVFIYTHALVFCAIGEMREVHKFQIYVLWVLCVCCVCIILYSLFHVVYSIGLCATQRVWDQFNSSWVDLNIWICRERANERVCAKVFAPSSFSSYLPQFDCFAHIWLCGNDGISMI